MESLFSSGTPSAFCLCRYYSTLKEFIGGREDAQLTILRTLYETWRLHGQVYFQKLFVVFYRLILILMLFNELL